MSVKLMYKEWLDFIEDSNVWKDSSWYEDEFFTCDKGEIDEVNIDDLDKEKDIGMQLTLHSGVLHTDDYNYKNGRNTISLVSVFKKWRKDRNCIYLLIKVDKNKESDIVEYLNKIDASIVSSSYK